jgi:hypothetical protein
MVSRGELGLVVAALGLTNGLITPLILSKIVTGKAQRYSAA